MFKHNLKWEPHVDTLKVLLEFLHTGIDEKILEELDKEYAAFKHLQYLLPKTSEVKDKFGVFIES